MTTAASVSMNVNVTNNLDFGAGSAVTDAVLIVNENNCTAPSPTGSNFAAPFGTGCAGTDTRFQAPQYGVLATGNRLEWNSVDFPVPGASVTGIPVADCSLGGCFPAVTTIRVTSMRVNASQLGVPELPLVPSTQVIAFLSLTGPATISVQNNQLNVAVPILGLVSSWSPVALGAQCAGAELEASITAREGFATAFKTSGAPTFMPQMLRWESGYFAPGSNLGGGASQGTRLLLQFFDVPVGVEVSAPKVIETGNPLVTGDALRLQWVDGADAGGAGGTVSSDTGMLSVPLLGGSGAVVYEVTDTLTFRTESVEIPVFASWAEGVGAGEILATLSLAPVSTVFTSSAEAPEPRFVENNALHTLFGIEPCGGDPRVEIDSSPNTAIRRRLLQYRVRVTNDGPEWAGGVMASVDLPADFLVRRAIGCVEGATGWACDVGLLAPGASRILLFAGTVAPAASGGLTAFAQVSSDLADPNPANDSASLSVPLGP
jgi:hypothetical protein